MSPLVLLRHKTWLYQPWRWQLYSKPFFSQGKKKKIKKIPKSVSVNFLYRFTTLLSTSSPCIFELPCYRITRPFVSVRCTADCSLQTAARVAVSPGLLKGDRNRSGERSFRRFPLSQWELLRMPGTEPVSIGARIIGHP